jgi:hypothetical protein
VGEVASVFDVLVVLLRDLYADGVDLPCQVSYDDCACRSKSQCRCPDAVEEAEQYDAFALASLCYWRCATSIIWLVVSGTLGRWVLSVLRFALVGVRWY